MTKAEWIAKWHNPAAKANRMVYSIWEDGEVTLEKGGDLFGHRNCHMIEGACIRPWDFTIFPVTNSSHGRIFLANGTYEEALAEMRLAT